MAKATNRTINDLYEVIGELATTMSQSFERLEKRLDGRMDGLEIRMDTLDSSQAETNQRLNRLEIGQRETNQRLEDVDGRLEAIENDVKELYGLLTKADKNKTSFTKHELRQIDDLWKWAEQVSSKTGVPLPSRH